MPTDGLKQKAQSNRRLDRLFHDTCGMASGRTFASARLCGSGLAEVESKVVSLRLSDHEDNPHEELNSSDATHPCQNQHSKIHVSHRAQPLAYSNPEQQHNAKSVKMW